MPSVIIVSGCICHHLSEFGLQCQVGTTPIAPAEPLGVRFTKDPSSDRNLCWNLVQPIWTTISSFLGSFAFKIIHNRQQLTWQCRVHREHCGCAQRRSQENPDLPIYFWFFLSAKNEQVLRVEHLIATKENHNSCWGDSMLTEQCRKVRGPTLRTGFLFNGWCSCNFHNQIRSTQVICRHRRRTDAH